MRLLGTALVAVAIGGGALSSGQPAAGPQTSRHSAPTAAKVSNAEALGQLMIATYAATKPPQSLLTAIKRGQIGSVILMGANTADSVSVTRRATVTLQRAAASGGRPGLLIMTDQEGGEVKRLPGAPEYAAAQMSNTKVAFAQGLATARVLRRAGVNVDLAPVADVTRVDGFMTQEQRTFGSNPAVVAGAACAFAGGLRRGGIAYTLKHFPGLGDAIDSTDTQPVTISESASEVNADDAAYRRCGRGPETLVMVSSASYSHLTGRLPAVMSPFIYHTLMPRDHIRAVTVSDTLQGGAIAPWKDPARRAIAAGVDMVMYPQSEAAALSDYRGLLGDLSRGTLSASRVQQAAAAVLTLKRNLGLR